MEKEGTRLLAKKSVLWIVMGRSLISAKRLIIMI